MVRLSKDLPQGVQLQMGMRYVGALPNPAVPSYTLFDGRIGWRINPNVEAALTVQNLFDRRHVEFGNLANASEFGRRAFANVTWKF
jgi:iron complex outermembrane receptor protein